MSMFERIKPFHSFKRFIEIMLRKHSENWKLKTENWFACELWDIFVFSCSGNFLVGTWLRCMFDFKLLLHVVRFLNIFFLYVYILLFRFLNGCMWCSCISMCNWNWWGWGRKNSVWQLTVYNRVKYTRVENIQSIYFQSMRIFQINWLVDTFNEFIIEFWIYAHDEFENTNIFLSNGIVH